MNTEEFKDMIKNHGLYSPNRSILKYSKKIIAKAESVINTFEKEEDNEIPDTDDFINIFNFKQYQPKI